MAKRKKATVRQKKPLGIGAGLIPGLSSSVNTPLPKPVPTVEQQTKKPVSTVTQQKTINNQPVSTVNQQIVKEPNNTYNIDKVRPASPINYQVDQAPFKEVREFEPLVPEPLPPQEPNALRDFQSQDPSRVGVNPNAPVAPNVPAPQTGLVSQDPSKTGVNPNAPTDGTTRRVAPPATPTDPQTGQPEQPASPVVDELQTKKEKLETDITALSERIANIPSATLAAQEKLGINEDQRQLQAMRENLSNVKNDLLTAQDEEVGIRERGRSLVSQFGGTAGDFGATTGEQFRRNALGQLALSRTYSRLGDAVGNVQASINNNISILNERADAERAKFEFDIEQKNNILDRVIQTQGSILSSQRKADLEDVKHQNALELVREKARLDGKKAGASSLLNGGTDPTLVNSFFASDDPDERNNIARSALMNGELSVKDYLAIARNNSLDKIKTGQDTLQQLQDAAKTDKSDRAALEVRRAKNTVANDAGDAVNFQSDEMLNSINFLLGDDPEATNGRLNNILGAWDQNDFLFTWGDDEKQMKSALDHIFATETVETLAQMKGNPSDKDMEVVMEMARGGFDRNVDDPTRLVKKLIRMKDSLEEAKIKESEAREFRNNSFSEELNRLNGLNLPIDESSGGGTIEEFESFFDSGGQKKNAEIVTTNRPNVYGGKVKVTQMVSDALDIAEKALGIDLKIADSARSTETQRQAYESGKAGVAPPGTSFHETGNAIDLSQTGSDNMNNQKVFAALRRAGLQQHPGEWWHWSRGEFNRNLA